MMKRWILIASLLIPLGVLATLGQQFGARETFTHSIDQTGDTAKVYKVNLLHPHDSFAYVDTVYATTTPIAVTWQSHRTVRRIAVIATPLVSTHDTIIVDHGAANDTITIDCDPALSRAVLCDSIVARVNAATMSDTVTAQDSGTYVKVISDLAQEAMNGDARFTLAYGTGNHNISAGTSDTTSVKMICDSMSAAINATVTVSDTVTAANDGDTVYTVTGDRAGYDITLSPGDTIQKGDTTVVVAAKASSSYEYDTIPLPIRMWEGNWHNLYGDIIMQSSKTTTKGYGTKDSVWFKLYKVGVVTGTWTLIAGDSGALPRTWHIAHSTKDTLFGSGELKVILEVMDTATDAAGSYAHDVDWNLTAWE